jgi:hypothetical protein
MKLGVDLETKDFAAEAIQLNRDPIRSELDEYEHFGNRRLRTTGELIQEAFRVGLYRMERVVRERMTTEDVDTITPQTIINIRPVVAALKEFFGSSQLSQFMDQTNSLVGLTHRRRLSALGAAASPASALRSRCATSTRPTTGACARSRPGRPEHRPDRLARVDGDRVRVRLHPDAVPSRQDGKVTDEIIYLSTRRGRPSTRSPRPPSRSTRRRASS